MMIYPQIDPIFFAIGPLKVHWYGIMYLVGFVGAWFMARYRIKRCQLPWNDQQLSDLLFFAALGVVVGGRVGYMVFYNLHELLHAPWSLFALWQGGMSFHGGLLGVMVALFYFASKENKPFLEVGDFCAPLVPIGLAAGRVGNFINGELWGRATDVPWAMIFPHVDFLPRHPSQLYEFLLEGGILFCCLWLFSAKRRPRGACSGLFLVLYGCFRFGVEFFREPDSGMGYIAYDWLTMGQLLSFPMIGLGLGLVYYAYHRSPKEV